MVSNTASGNMILQFGRSLLLIYLLNFASIPLQSEVLANESSTAVKKSSPLVSSMGQDNYLEEAVREGAARWKSERMPIVVFIKSGTGVKGYRANFDDILKQSFAQWSEVSDGKISFKFTTSPSEALISCAWTDNAGDMMDSDEEGEAVPRLSDNGELVGSKILILTSLPEYTEGPSDERVRGVCLHEVGHALGLDHSSQASDVMFGGASSVAALSDRDKKTLLGLYSASESFMASHPVRFDKSVGQGSDPKVRQINLNNQGILDAKAGNLTKAIANFEAAFKLAPGDSSIATNLGTAYATRANKEIILQNEPAAEKDFKLAVLYLSKGGQKTTAAQICDTLVFIARSHKREADALKYEGIKRILQSAK